MSQGSLLHVAGYLRRLAPPGHLVGLADEQLVCLFVSQSDEGAFELLVQRHGPMVLGVCRRLLRRAEDVEDAFQATFLVLARKANTLARPEALPAWLHGVALRIARKARQRRPLAPLPEDLPQKEPVHSDLAELFDIELARLPERYQVPIVLCCLEGLSREETAKRLGQSEGAIKGLLERGRQRLREQLERRGVCGTLFPATMAAPAVPRHFVEAVGVLLTGAVSSSVHHLAQGALWSMMIAKWKTMVALLLVCLVCAGASLAWGPEKQVPSPQAFVSAPVPASPEPGMPTATLEIDVKSNVRALRFSADGRYLITGSDDSRVIVWDAKTGKAIRTFASHKKEIRSLAASKDGKLLISGDEGGVICLWDIARGLLLAQMKVGTGGALGLALSPDDRQLACATGTDEVRLYDAITLRLGQTLRPGDMKEELRTIAYSPDGKSLLSGGQVTLNTGATFTSYHLTELATGKTITGTVGSLNPKQPNPELHPAPLSFSPDGKTWIGATGTRFVVKFREHKIASHKEPVTSLHFLPDGKSFVSASRDGTILFTDSITMKPIVRLTRLGKIQSLALSGDGKRLAVTTEDGKVKIHEVAKLDRIGKSTKP
jgi:RNA polymerase sigma factor (sigma-70 family)